MSLLKSFKISVYKLFLIHRRQSVTVRYAFPFMFIAMAFFGASSLVGTNTSYLRLDTDTTDIQKDDSFVVDIYAGTHTPVNAIDVAIQFPTDMVDVTGIDTGESVITLWTTEPYVDEGVVYLRGGTFRKGFLGEHLLARINVKALQTGNVQFITDKAQFLAGDGSGSTVPIKSNGSDVLTVEIDPEKNVFEAVATVVIYTDVDGDGNVDMRDVLSFMDAWFGNGTRYDFNHDSVMNFTDFAIILSDSFYK